MHLQCTCPQNTRHQTSHQHSSPSRWTTGCSNVPGAHLNVPPFIISTSHCTVNPELDFSMSLFGSCRFSGFCVCQVQWMSSALQLDHGSSWKERRCGSIFPQVGTRWHSYSYFRVMLCYWSISILAAMSLPRQPPHTHSIQNQDLIPW